MDRSGASIASLCVTSMLFLAAVAFLPSNLRAVEKPDVRARLIAPARVPAGSKATLVVEMAIGEHWHVNSHIPSEPYLIPMAVALTASRGALSAVRYPKDVKRSFEFADQPLRVYEGTVRFEADLEIPAGTGDASHRRTSLLSGVQRASVLRARENPLDAMIGVSR